MNVMEEISFKVEHEPSVEIREIINSISPDNFDKICRTCLSQTIDLRSCFDIINENICIADLIQDFTSVLVDNDFLPQNICNVCVKQLLTFNTFKLKCIHNEKILSLIKTEINKVEENVLILQENNDNINEIMSHNICLEELSNSEFSNIDTKSKNTLDTNINCSERILRNKKTTRKKKLANIQFKCKNCFQEFDSRELLKEHHTLSKHSENCNSQACTVCNKMFTSSKLKQHMRAHTKEKPYICKVCSQGFSMSGNLKRHMMTHTGERPHVCEICTKGFIQATTLATHRRTHSNIERAAQTAPNYICNYCGRGFKRIARYNAHLKRHFSDSDEITITKKASSQGVREYMCDQCERTYKTKHLLKAHQLTHGEKTYLCSECGKGFVTKAALQSHLKVHTGEKPHTCNVCGKAFAHVGSFEAHMLIHTGHKPYNCTICAKTFTQLSHLKYHLRTHSGERPYICSYCGKSFALKGNLTVHVRIHTGETPYSCPLCKKGFYDSSSMKKHRRGHGETNSNTLHNQTSANSDSMDNSNNIHFNSNIDLPPIKRNSIVCKF